MAVRTAVKARPGSAEPSKRAPTNLSLPRDLVAELDEVVGPRNRSAFVEEAIRYRLRREKMRQAFDRAFGIWADRPEFATSEKVVEWVRARRSEETSTAGDDE